MALVASGIVLSSTLSGRDQAVVELVGRFRQLSAAHIGSILFAGSASKTPLDRCLKRLVEQRYLARLARPVGGDGGGSAQFVYQLGRAGWRLLGKSGAYWVPRAVNRHTLAIADCYVQLCRAERAGEVAVLAFEPEPLCHVNVGTIQLTPDAFAEIGVRALNAKFSFWLEVDRGTEHGQVIKDKCIRYWRAYKLWEGAVFPYVVFVVPDESRRQEVCRVVAGGPDQAQDIFQVTLMDQLTEVIQGKLCTGICANRGKRH
jgi:hypothetical protein